ncbi:PREDICTED: uncharacterized protein LOC108765771 isoform X2 [Trachymyrmex cornetzi]|uniref:uncharacterized protein LOC108765771 isoform X2 n=1 Tax=Trachymyrmex cornetzi TaxID=471704 RepID=UPI00084F5CBD|nr:PREDICTED: uncharacterized protein LOC108765771 isoform X2 [Trachymyrmex cornetzi]
MALLAMSYRIGKSTVSGIIQETCEAIWEVLQPQVLEQPSQQDWIKIEDEFFKRWNFPHCIGAIDGKHVAPPHAGSTFYNFKGQHSIVLLAIVSASYKFLMVDIGAQGRHNDGRIFKESNMGQRFQNKQMDLPHPCQLSNFRNIPIPYMLVVNIWRIYRKPINASLKTTESIIKATVCLHNFLLSTRQYGYMTDDICQNVIHENTAAIRDVSNIRSNTHSQLAASIRNEFCEYFVQEGSVPWQEMYI